jgi:hypothetical protein
MHDSRRVSFGQPFGNLLQITQELPEISAIAMDALAQSFSIDELHRDEVRPIAFSDLVYMRDVRMIESGGGGRFLLEAPHSIVIRSDILRQYL